MFELTTLLEAEDEVNSRLRSQAVVQQDMPEALVRRIQTEFNESFRQVFTSHLLVRWPHSTPLIRTFATVHFNLGTVTMHRELPTTVTSHRSAGPPHKTLTTSYIGKKANTATSQMAG